MKLVDQVCSLELSIKLKELGVKQQSIFLWEFYNDNCYGIKYYPYAIFPSLLETHIKIYSAFTVSELGEFIPPLHYTIKSKNNIYFVPNQCLEGGYEITKTFEDKNEANVRARMLIYLIKNGLMTNENI